VTDLELEANETNKFHSRYLDRLIGRLILDYFDYLLCNRYYIYFISNYLRYQVQIINRTTFVCCLL